MFSLDEFKKSRLYQDINEEGKLKGKLEAIPALIQKRFSIEEIANILKLDIETVRQAVDNLPES